jgi:hypothetical protein
MNNLKNLVQESRQLTNHILPTNLTPLERGIEQIEAQTKRLLKRTTSRQAGPQNKKVDNRTQYLLASKGIDADKVLETLVDINLGLTFEPLQGVPDTDIEGFLRNEHETLVSFAIEETRNQAVMDFEAHYEKTVQSDWSKQKRRIIENFGHHSLTQMDIESRGMNHLIIVADTGLQISTGLSGLVSAGIIQLMQGAYLNIHDYKLILMLSRKSMMQDYPNNLIMLQLVSEKLLKRPVLTNSKTLYPVVGSC